MKDDSTAMRLTPSIRRVSLRAFAHCFSATTFAGGIAAFGSLYVGCYGAHERRDDRADADEEASFAYADGQELQLVTADGRLGARVPFGESTIVYLRSEGVRMGGVTHRNGRAIPFVIDPFGAFVRREETSTMVDPTNTFGQASAFVDGEYAFGAGSSRTHVGGQFAADGLHPWPGECFPVGPATPFGGNALISCRTGSELYLGVMRDGEFMPVDIGGRSVFAWGSRYDNSVFQLGGEDRGQSVLFQTDTELMFFDSAQFVAESNTELVLRVDERCLRRIDKRSGATRDVCRESVIQSAALTGDGELFVVEGDDARRLVRVRDGMQVGVSAWALESALIASGNTLAFRIRVGPNPPDGFDGMRSSFVWLVDAESMSILVSRETEILPGVCLSGDGQFAAFVWLRSSTVEPIHATWINLQTLVERDIEARRAGLDAFGDFAFFHGPDVWMSRF